MRLKIAIAIIASMIPCASFAQGLSYVSCGTSSVPCFVQLQASTAVIGSVTGSYPVLVASSTMTRASNTTTYTANTAVCLNTSTTACVPMTVSLATTNAGKGLINRVLLLKSSATTTNASFNIWFYSTTPTTTSIYDDTAYVGPFKADVPYYIGSATCSTANVTTDGSAGVWFECTLNNPNTGGAIPFQAATGSTNISAMLEVTAAYAPASAETFTFYVSGVY